MSGPVSVVLVDDHQIVREGLRTLFADEPGIQVVGEAGSAAEGFDVAAALKPDVVLLDLVMPGGGAVQTIERLRRELPSVRILVLTSYAGDRQVHEALKAGAIGYLLKDVSRAELVRAIHSVHQGQPALHAEAQRHLLRGVSGAAGRSALAELTARERSVLELIARGRSNKAIAAELKLSEGTVKGYVSVVLGKLGVEDRTQAALFAVKHGLVEASDL